MSTYNHAVDNSIYIDIFMTNNGISLMTAMFISLSVHSIFANISFMPILHLVRAIIILSGMFIIINWLIALVGFNKKNYYIAKWALIFWSAYICFWITAVAYTLTPIGETYLCSYRRCPESLWMFNNSWHNNGLIPHTISDYELDDNYKIDVVKLLDHTTQRSIPGKPGEKKTTTTTTATVTLDLYIIQNHAHNYNSIKTKETNLHKKVQMIYTNVTTTTRENLVNDIKMLEKIHYYPTTEKIDYDASWDDTFTGNVRSDNIEYAALPIRSPSDTSFRVNIIHIVVIIITFSILLFGWLVLLSHVLELKYLIKECCPQKVSSDNVNLGYKMSEKFDPYSRCRSSANINYSKCQTTYL